MSRLTMGSLFDGIGGFPLAAIRSGITPVWASEIEAFPIEVTKLRFPDMVHVGDITKLNGAELPPVDIICGGSPCQDLSVAGARAGLAGARSGLFMEQMRIVREMRLAEKARGRESVNIRPRWMCWENVPGAFSSGTPKYEDFRIVLEEIVRICFPNELIPSPYPYAWPDAGELTAGGAFSLAWRCLDAQFWGVAQRRKRIFLLADFAGPLAPQLWKYKAVDYILQNERYAGNALLQKRYTTATLPKQQKINHGEREMYYVADSNEAIIPQELFDRAKELRQRRSVGQAVTHGRLCVRMRCSCGSRIRAKQVNGRWYWCCCRHDEKGDCAIKPVPEAQTDEAICRLYYKLKHQSLPILEQMLETLQTIRDRRLLWSEDIVSLNKKISELSSQNQTLAFLKQNGLVDPDIFISKSNELTRQLRQAKLDKEELMAAEGDATAQRTQELIALLEDGPDFLDHPDTELCGALVAEIIVESNDTLRFRLHNGLELRESIERTVR